MAHTHTRPPTIHRSARRPPRGPRTVPRAPKHDRDTTIHARLAAGAAKLREIGEPDLAAAIDEVLTPTGWGRLRRVEASTSGSLPSNKPIRVERTVREHLKKAAAAAGEDLTDQANAGLSSYLNGKFTPAAPARAPYGSSPDKVVLNLRADDDLWQRTDQAKAARKAELGWTPHPSTVALAWLLHKYPLPETHPAE